MTAGTEAEWNGFQEKVEGEKLEIAKIGNFDVLLQEKEKLYLKGGAGIEIFGVELFDFILIFNKRNNRCTG